MKFAVLKEKITPHIPVFQCGFSARTHKSEGVHDDPYASVVLLCANKTVAIIAFDLVGGDRSFANSIKKAIYEKFKLSEDQIILNFSHTHSVVAITGDDPIARHRRYSINMEKQSWDLDEKDIDLTEDIKYYNIVKSKILNMLEYGLNNMIEGNAYVIKGKSKFGVSRRYPSDEGALWRPYFNEDAMDPDLYLIKLEDKAGRVRGILYNYACHPTAMCYSNYMISADFPGVVRKYLEEAFPDSVAVFLQGCGADIKPVCSADKEGFKHCTFDELEEAGAAFAKEIQALLEKPEGSCGVDGWRKIDMDIKFLSSEVKLYSEFWSEKKWQAIADDPNEPGYRKAAAKRMAAMIKEGDVKNYIPYYISYLRLDDKTAIVALENEVVSDIGKDIKKVFRDKNVIVLGYSNSVKCYIPTQKVIAGGGYESQSFISAGLPGQFVDEVEDIILGRITMLAKDCE